MIDAKQDRRINYIELPVSNINQAKTFFSAVFDWTFVDYGAEYCSFKDGTFDGGFRLEPAPQPGGPLVVFFAVNLEETAERVKKHGGRIVQEIFSFPGGRRFHFQDPEGDGEYAVWTDRN